MGFKGVYRGRSAVVDVNMWGIQGPGYFKAKIQRLLRELAS